MASSGRWVVVFDDKSVVKNYDEGAGEGQGYKIDDDAFWNQSKFSNIWSIQYQTSNVNDEVEYRDETEHTSFADANLGDFQEFIDRWDAAHLEMLQTKWDYDVLGDGQGNVIPETEQEQITRKGPRPTSYTSAL